MQDKQATLANSDGVPASEHAERLLNELVNLLIKELKETGYQADLVRTLGYTSTDNRYFQNLLVKHLKKPYLASSDELYFACSFSLRESKGFEFLVKHAVDEYLSTSKISNVKLVAISRCLQYRLRISETLEFDTANILARGTLHMFNNQLDKRTGSYVFRNSATLLGYLLRYRMFNSQFLPKSGKLTDRLRTAFVKAYFLSDRYDPAHPRSAELKKRFEEIYKDCVSDPARLRTMGGVIDIQAALLQLLDYVDRKGKGVISMDS